MRRLKPYYNLISECEIETELPCADCDSVKVVEECWCEFGHGYLPDDYVNVTRCECGRVVE